MLFAFYIPVDYTSLVDKFEAENDLSEDLQNFRHFPSLRLFMMTFDNCAHVRLEIPFVSIFHESIVIILFLKVPDILDDVV